MAKSGVRNKSKNEKDKKKKTGDDFRNCSENDVENDSGKEEKRNEEEEEEEKHSSETCGQNQKMKSFQFCVQFLLFQNLSFENPI